MVDHGESNRDIMWKSHASHFRAARQATERSYCRRSYYHTGVAHCIAHQPLKNNPIAPLQASINNSRSPAHGRLLVDAFGSTAALEQQARTAATAVQIDDASEHIVKGGRASRLVTQGHTIVTSGLSSHALRTENQSLVLHAWLDRGVAKGRAAQDQTRTAVHTSNHVKRQRGDAERRFHNKCIRTLNRLHKEGHDGTNLSYPGKG